VTRLAWARPAGTAVLAAAVALLVWGVSSSDRSQVTNGELVYIQYCLTCHGAALEGGSGPPLQGPAFERSVQVGKMSPAGLLAFISHAMPMDAPGSLSKQQYQDVLAFIRSKDANSLPNPAASVSPAPAPTATVPASANVALDDAMLRSAAGDPNDWRLPGRTYGNWRYSPLTQIDAGNVHTLVPVKIVHTGMYASFETTPLVAGGVMYLTTPVVDGHMKIMALDAATGDVVWTTSYGLGPYKGCCGPNNRGAALAYGNLYVTTLDAKLVAFDARTGRERWEQRVADPTAGYSESMAPQVYDGLVIVGSAGGEWALRGFVAAYDARTGAQRWRWFATDPATFAGNSWKTGGGTVWTTPAIDAERNLVIFGTGNPNPDLDGSVRAGDNRYTDSIVALDVHAGKLRWFYQEVKHDRWDYDATSNVVLFDVHRNGQTIPAAGQAGKVGWFFIVDRRTGTLLQRSQPFVQQNAHLFSEKAVLPGANGGSEWSPPAYSPRAHAAYVLGINQLMDFTVQTPGDHPGFIRTGSLFANVKRPKVQTGTFSAIDVDSGKIVWQYHAPMPMVGGALATAGGVVFAGEGDGSFDAFDAANGTKLWTYRFPGGANAPPVSYAVNGTQYVAIAAGGSYQFDYKRGDEVGIFRLNR
jgi:alcohol dehydrogenase (cytochrome c)